MSEKIFSGGMMIKKLSLRVLVSLVLTACGQQDASIELGNAGSTVRNVSSVASANPGNPSDPSGTVRILAPLQSADLPYAKFKLIFSIQDSDQLQDCSIKVDGVVVSQMPLAGNSLYVEKDMPISSCREGTLIFPGEHVVEVSYRDRLGNELKASTSFSLNQ